MAGKGTSFDEMIQADRRQRLAQEMLGSKGLSGRNTPTADQGASLASRVGVTKRSSSAQPISNIDGKWGHDLHHVNNPRIINRRVHNPRLSNTRVNNLRVSRVSPLNRTASSPSIERGLAKEASLSATESQVNFQKPSMNIKGMATTGPYVVVASNFAPGTTEDDIKAAMAPVGGEITSCQLVSSSPTVMAELILPNREGAANVIETFNNQKADGKVLYVYMKQGGPTPGLHPLQNTSQAAAPQPPREPERDRRDAARREPAAARDVKDVMDVDYERGDGNDGRLTTDRRYYDRNQRGERYDERNRDSGSFQDGRYGFKDPYDTRDTRRYYGRPPPYRGAGAYRR